MNNSSGPEQNKSKALGESINLSSIQKKRPIRKMPTDQINNINQTVSKELPEQQEPGIVFNKADNLKDEDDNIPEKTKLNQQNKNELDQELNNLEGNSGLIDSSAYGTEMIEGLVKGMSHPKLERKIYNDSSELESAHEGNIQFNEVSPSHFNIQNQRY